MKKVLILSIITFVISGCSNPNISNSNNIIKDTFENLATTDTVLKIDDLKNTLSNCEFNEDSYFTTNEDKITYTDVHSYSFKQGDELLNIEMLNEDNTNITYQINSNKEIFSDLIITKNTSTDKLSATFSTKDINSKNIFINTKNSIIKFNNKSNTYSIYSNLEENIKNHSFTIDEIQNQFNLNFKSINNTDTIDYIYSNEDEKLVLTYTPSNIIKSISYESSNIISYCMYSDEPSTENSNLTYGVIINAISDTELISF